jgi:ATP-binding cassette subfamily B protein
MFLLRGERVLLLSLANVVLAGLQFLDPVLFGRVIGLLAAHAGWVSIAPVLALWAGIGLAVIGLGIATALFADRLAHRQRLAAMARFFAHALTLPAGFHAAAPSGQMMKIMLSGADGLFWLWLSFFREQLATATALLVLLPFSLLLNWRLGLVLVVLALVFAVVTIAAVRHTEAGQQRAQAWQVRLVGTAQDTLANVTLVQAFTRLGAERRLFGELAAHVVAHQFPVLGWWAVVNVLTRAASTVAVMAIVLVGAWLNLEGRAEVAEIVAFMGLAVLLIGRMDAGMTFIARLFQAAPDLRAYFATLDTESSVPDRPGAQAFRPGAGEVVFDRVDFAYPGATGTLRDISFTARAGSVTALVGHTGAGKTTCMALLQRAWDPDRGSIRIDGQDISSVQLESLRGAIGVVFQESLLLNRSIRDNLLLGRPEASEAELEAAARAAEALDFILAQPEGWDTVVGERGSLLSGGQRQRLAIARALLKNPPILILDEATSALDAQTEARVATALRALMRGRTTFVIAHRLSTIRDADEILVFAQGRIVEHGGYAELLARDGAFAALVRSQLSTGMLHRT